MNTKTRQRRERAIITKENAIARHRRTIAEMNRLMALPIEEPVTHETARYDKEINDYRVRLIQVAHNKIAIHERDIARTKVNLSTR